MTAFRLGVATVLALAGCTAASGSVRRQSLPPPAQEIRAGAPDRGAGPASGARASVQGRRPPASTAGIPASTPTPSPSPRPSAPLRGGEGGHELPTSSATSSSNSGAPLAPERQRAVDAATALVGRRTIVVDGVDYGSDCVALVRAVLQHAGSPLPPSARDAAAIYRFAARQGALEHTQRPTAGVVVFLADRRGGAPAHVGIVARLDPDGTALVLHRVARGVLRLRVNLAWPDRGTDPSTGRRVNDTLLVGTRPASAGSLVVGVADLLRVRG